MPGSTASLAPTSPDLRSVGESVGHYQGTHGAMTNDFKETRIPCAVLVILLMSLPLSSLYAQADQTPESWDYHLLAAFNSQPEDRRAINHIGLLSELRDGAYYVAAVLDGYPAHEAGLRRGDRLLSVDGEPFHPLKSFNVRSPTGFSRRGIASNYHLEYTRGIDTMLVDVEARFENLFDAYRSASDNSVQQFHAGNKIVGYVHLWALSKASNDLNFFLSVVRSCSGCDGMILDLRHSYGFLDISHLDALIGNRSNYAELKASREPTQNSYRTLIQTPAVNSERNAHYDRPIAVLQNGETRGQVELLLYQLNTLSRTLSIGEDSAGRLGKIDVSADGEGLPQLTYRNASDLLVDGQTLEDRGVSPRIHVEFPLLNTLTADPQYEAAVLALLEIM